MNLRPNDSAANPASPPWTADRSPCVLVVDDAPDCRELFISLVWKSGLRALSAPDGHAAQLLLLTENPVLVITDLSMPICDGWELLAFCHTRRPGLPVLLVSALPLGRRPDLEAWAAGFVEKPIDDEAFEAEVRRLTAARFVPPIFQTTRATSSRSPLTTRFHAT